jgi:EthD domain
MLDSRGMTLDLFVAETEPGDTDRWQRLVAAVQADLQQALPAATVTAWRHDPTALGGLAHGDETAQAPAFVALVQVERIAPERLSEVLDVLAAQLASYGQLDRDRSSVVVGEELVVVPGEQPLMLAMALPRRDSLDRVEFQRYWSTSHAELGRRVPGSQGYRQVHTKAAVTDEARRVLGVGGPDFDGVAVACYADRAAFLSIMANEAVIGQLLEDERKFIDHSRAAMVVGHAVH